MKILLADDHALFRDAMGMMVESIFPSSQVVFAENWEEVHSHIQESKFDIALLDLFMPRENSWEEELTRCIRLSPHLSICIITASSMQHHVKVALEIGVKGFICKTSGVLEIKKALLKIQQGKYYVQDSSHKQGHAGLKNITKRQKEVLVLLAEGKKNKDIATYLGVAESTVKRHVYDIYQLLGVNNRLKVGQIAREQGLVVH